MQVPDNIKVSVASFFGVVTPSTNLFLENVEPALKVVLLIAQIAVAVCSALYVHSKWKKNRK